MSDRHRWRYQHLDGRSASGTRDHRSFAELAHTAAPARPERTKLGSARRTWLLAIGLWCCAVLAVLMLLVASAHDSWSDRMLTLGVAAVAIGTGSWAAARIWATRIWATRATMERPSPPAAASSRLGRAGAVALAVSGVIVVAAMLVGGPGDRPDVRTLYEAEDALESWGTSTGDDRCLPTEISVDLLGGGIDVSGSYPALLPPQSNSHTSSQDPDTAHSRQEQALEARLAEIGLDVDVRSSGVMVPVSCDRF